MPSPATERPLFAGRAGSDATYSWIESVAEGLRVGCHSIGPGASQFFGGGEVETFLTIPTHRLEAVRHALLAELPEGSRDSTLIDLIARRWAGDSSVTAHLRMWLDARGIEYDFFVY